MPRTREQLEQAAADAERWLDGLDPDDPTVHVDKVGDLREIGDALARVGAAERRVASAVLAARENGRSWTDIGRALGVSRQAAQKRYDRSARSVGTETPVPIRPPQLRRGAVPARATRRLQRERHGRR